MPSRRWEVAVVSHNIERSSRGSHVSLPRVGRVVLVHARVRLS